jgi:selenide,water dikinase
MAVEKLPLKLAQEILMGGKSICEEAGIPLAGGHTIDSPEPIFGLSVNGLVRKEHLKRNSTARTGDLLYLTKPIGTGILTTALKRKLITEEALVDAVTLMCTPNTAGALFGTVEQVHAMTDVTGFGLLGHLLEMCEGSNLAAEIHYDALELVNGAEELAKKFIAPDNTFRNWKSYEPKVSPLTGEQLVTLCDPQTSGGLLVAVDKTFAESFENILKDCNLEKHIKPIGALKEKSGDKWISVL